MTAVRPAESNCLTHGRRQFVDVLAHFPEPCRHVIETSAPVYQNDELAKEQVMSPEQRLAFHQTRSGPLMDGLHTWLLEQGYQKLVEPNSGLGQSHRLHTPSLGQTHGLPAGRRCTQLDNNLCEHVLKRAIVHRKNSLFYKTQHGAEVGDLYMSLIATCEQNGVNPLTYLPELDERPWRQMIGYVPQDTVLLHDTICRNVTLGASELGECDVEEALVAAGAWEFVQAMPEGIHSTVGEREGNLSRGQRQCIAIARALVYKPKLLILDEATSALDSVSEAVICDASGVCAVRPAYWQAPTRLRW